MRMPWGRYKETKAPFVNRQNPLYKNGHGRTDEVCVIKLYQTPTLFASKMQYKNLETQLLQIYPFHHEMGRGYNVSTQNLNERAVKKNSIPFISNMHTSLSCRISLESSSFILRVPLQKCRSEEKCSCVSIGFHRFASIV